MKNNLLSIRNLKISAGKTQIVKNIDLYIKSGQIHVIMGPNGSGKSSLILGIAGHPDYQIDEGLVCINKENITKLKPCEKSRKGLMISFQNPIAIPGVSLEKILRTAFQKTYPQKKFDVFKFHTEFTKLAKTIHIKEELLKRNFNEGFSGGERKMMEILAMLILKPKFIFFDEIDTGLDLDALKLLSQIIIKLKNIGCGMLFVTHNPKAIKYLPVNKLHILYEGKIIQSGNLDLLNKIESDGYAKI